MRAREARTGPAAGPALLLVLVASVAILAGFVVALANLSRAELWLVGLVTFAALFVGAFVWVLAVGRNR